MWESYVSSEVTRTGGISYRVYLGNRGWNVKGVLVRELLLFLSFNFLSFSFTTPFVLTH